MLASLHLEVLKGAYNWKEEIAVRVKMGLGIRWRVGQIRFQENCKDQNPPFPGPLSKGVLDVTVFPVIENKVDLNREGLPADGMLRTDIVTGAPVEVEGVEEVRLLVDGYRYGDLVLVRSLDS